MSTNRMIHMPRALKLAALFAGAAMVTACTTSEANRPAPAASTTIAGAVVGGVATGAIGSGLEGAARQKALAAETEAYGSGQTVNWRADVGNVYGQVAPGPSYTYSGLSCRNYTHAIFIDGTAQVARGRACRQPDGSWRQTA
ncbi:MAG: hypothetical protein AAF321_09865 [Pseudomonadota bacterium]